MFKAVFIVCVSSVCLELFIDGGKKKTSSKVQLILLKMPGLMVAES